MNPLSARALPLPLGSTALLTLLLAGCGGGQPPRAPTPEVLRPLAAPSSGTVFNVLNACGGKALEVAGNSGANDANVDLWSLVAGATNEQWKLTATDSGYYTLTAQHSGKVMDVGGANTAIGANVAQYTAVAGATNQQWAFTDMGNGQYKITPRHATNRVLESVQGNLNDGANVQLGGDIGGCHQRWTLSVVGGTTPPAPTAPVNNTVYNVLNACANKALDVNGASQANSANVDLWSLVATATNEQWKVSATDSGYYTLTAQHSSKVLDVGGASTAVGANVAQYSLVAGAANQQWAFTDMGGGQYKITPRHATNRVLEREQNNANDGANVQIGADVGGCHQRWTLSAVGSSGGGTGGPPPAGDITTPPPTDLSAVSLPALPSGSWQSLNPGAGGQIQGVVLDPNQADRAFLLSDVEGTYVTNDGGASWVYSSRGLAGSDSLALAVRPGNSRYVYLGTSVGLHTSTDGGKTWKLHPTVNRSGGTLTDDPNDPGYGSGKMSIGSVAIDPQNANLVVAGLGGRRWSRVGAATVYRSGDGGVTFGKVVFGSGTGNQSVLQLAVNPINRNLYAATGDGGLWVSNAFGASGTWTRLSKPGDATERVEGVAVTPDGKTLFAVYQDAGNSASTVIYASRTAALDWKKLSFGGVNGETPNHLRTVSLDPRSSENAQRLVTADDIGRNGLYEVNVSWSGATPSATWSKVFYFGKRQGPDQADNPNARFDPGWEGGIFGNRPRPLSYGYTPTGWNKYELWTTGDQTVFKTDRGQSSFADLWQAKYTSKVSTLNGPINGTGVTNGWDVNVGWTVANTYGAINGDVLDITSLGPISTYKTTGISSTVDFDASVYGNIVLSSKADHGIVTSYDGGVSWEDISDPRRARSNSNAIIEAEPGRIYMLAHFSYPFDFGGGGNDTGELWGAYINPSSPTPTRWWYLAGGDTGATYTSLGAPFSGSQSLGLPNDLYTNIVPDLSNPKRVFITTKKSGVYRIDDITFLYCVRIGIASCGSNLPAITKISDVGSNEYEQSAVLDPNNPGTLFVADKNTLKKLNLSSTPAMVTNLLSTGADRLITFSAWNQGGTTWLAATQNGNSVSVSGNGGASWTPSFTLSDLTAARTPSFDFSLTQSKLELTGVKGYGNKLYAVAQVANPENLGYGVFEVTLNTNGTRSSVRDLTENMPFPKSLRTEIITNPVGGQTSLMMSSWGAGLWKRPLP